MKKERKDHSSYRQSVSRSVDIKTRGISLRTLVMNDEGHRIEKKRKIKIIIIMKMKN